MNRRHVRSDGILREGVYTKTSSLSLAVEARELQKCSHNALKTAHVRAVTLLKFYPESNELVTKWVKSDSLFNRIWNASTSLRLFRGSSKSRNLMQTRLSELGQWLAKYHDVDSYPGPEAEAAAASREIIANVVNGFRRKLAHAEVFNLLPGRLIPALRSYGETLGDVLANGDPLPIATIHGDFVAHNICVDDSADVYILDFADSRLGFRLEDVVRLWEQLSEVSMAGGVATRWLAQALDDFLLGYGFKTSVVTCPKFEALRVMNALTNILTAHKVTDYIGISDRLVARRITRVTIRWLEKELSTSRN